MNSLKSLKKKYEDAKFALTIPYGHDKTWDNLSDENFIKFLDCFQIVLYILVFSTPVAVSIVSSFYFIKNNL